MKSNEVKCTYEERTSKSGNVYKCLVIKISDDYEKIVFLARPEQALIESYLKKDSEFNFNEL